MPPEQTVTLSEFCISLGKKKSIHKNSIGGFAYYARKHGVPRKWPNSLWTKMFNEYLERKTSN